MVDYNCDQCGNKILFGEVARTIVDGQPKYFHSYHDAYITRDVGVMVTLDCAMMYSAKRMNETGMGTFFESLEFSKFEKLVQS